MLTESANITDRSRGRNGILCAILMVVAVLLAWPFANIGFIDDWSTVKTAQIFAQTGHFAYNGWEAAILGWQIWWGALFIKLFGFSFIVVRASTLPLSFLTVILFHQILVRCGISRRNAIFGSVALALSPLFLVMTASYMTDIPALLCILLCFYLCVRAVQARSDNAAIAWLALAAATNVPGGTVRQVAWLGVLVMVPSTAWLLRRRRGAMVAGLLLWSVSVAFIFLCMHWFKQQPYAVPEHFFSHAVNARTFVHLGSQTVKSFFCLVLITLPILVAWLPLVRKFSSRSRLIILLVLAALGVLWIAMPKDNGGDSFMMPWVTHVFADLGTTTQGNVLGPKPVNLHPWARVVISLAVAACALAFFTQLWSAVRQPRGRKLEAEAARYDAGTSQPPSWSELFWIAGTFYLTYIALLMFRAGTLGISIFDRYQLPLLAFNIIFLLRYYQQFVAARLPRVTTWVLIIFSVYGVAGLHDWYAYQRAVIQAADEVRASGVPRTAIRGGFEYDGWSTELSAVGHMDDPRLNGAADRPGKF